MEDLKSLLDDWLLCFIFLLLTEVCDSDLIEELSLRCAHLLYEFSIPLEYLARKHVRIQLSKLGRIKVCEDFFKLILKKFPPPFNN
jgi:hypothetical protein